MTGSLATELNSPASQEGNISQIIHNVGADTINPHILWVGLPNIPLLGGVRGGFS